MKKATKYILLVCPLLFSVACEDLVQDCSGTITATYNIGTDVDAEFSVNEVPFDAEILTSTCSNLAAGETTTGTVDTIARANGSITFTQDEESVPAEISGSSIGEFSRSETVAGCTITVTLTGTLDSSADTMTTSGDFTASGLTCNADL